MDNERKQAPRSILVVWITMILLTTGVAVAIFTGLLIYYRITDDLKTADAQLLIAAEMFMEIIGPEYHDNIDNRTSVSKEQFEAIVKRNDALCRHLNLQYLWSVLEVEGRLVFTTATHSDVHDSTSPCATFFEVHKDPDAFTPAMQPEMRPAFSSFKNEWGEGRMVLVPRIDSRGRRYIFGASLQLEKYNAIYRQALLAVLFVAVLVIGIVFLLALFLTRLVISPIVRLTKAADRMASGDLDSPLPSCGARELQSLSRSFGRMREELKRKIKSLRENEERLEKILETMAEGCVFIDSEGNIIFANSEAERILGSQRSEIKGKSYISSDWNILRPDGTPMPPEEMAGPRAMKEQRLIRNDIMGIKRNDGTICWTTVRAAPLVGTDNTLEGVIGTFTDISDQLRIQEELQNKQKLESLGILAGGIAHDFNNLMGGIFGYIDMALEETTQSDVASYLQSAVSTIDRARSLTRQLLTFAKGGEPAKEKKALSPFLETTAQFALSGSNVSCDFSIPNDLWKCEFDRNQIAQVIDNLVVNAKQAMPRGGAITITAENVQFNDGNDPNLGPGDYVKVSIKDTGPGMSREIVSKIFDPFFSTRPDGHGLGLSTCYSIIKRHGGFLDVDSEPGKGSTFHFFLPASPETSARPANSMGDSSAEHRGNGTILLMDDESVILDIEKKLLATFGYSVVCTKNGTEVIEYMGKNTDGKPEIIALILDLTIPGGLGGEETIRHVRKTNPDIPAFVSSGYADDPVMADPARYGFTASIRKPFRLAELAEMLNKYLKTD